VQLLIRTAMGTVTTDAGEILLEDARIILNRVREVAAEACRCRRPPSDPSMLGQTPSLTNPAGRAGCSAALPRRRRTSRCRFFEEFSHILIERVDRRPTRLGLGL